MRKTNINGRLFDDASQLLPSIYGDTSRVKIATTAVVNDIFINVSSGDVTIDEFAFFGHRVMLLTGAHDITVFNMERQQSVPPKGRDIWIKTGAWVASGAIILGPCVIGEHAVVGAGSLVRADVPPYAFVAGNPAKPVGSITETNSSPRDSP